VGVGLGQVQDARGVLVTALEAVAVVTVLELLWLQTNGTWLEQYVDFASVFAAALAPTAAADDAGGAKRVGFLHRFRTYRVCERYATFANALV
jgi:hypothetical protein